MRGGFSAMELTAIDNYAFGFGIEVHLCSEPFWSAKVFPCMQTLGHLGQILQWPRFSNIRDTSEVLLSQHEESYQFIEKMIDAVTLPLRSKKIHIGMDEANGIGQGKFRQLFGDKDGYKIFLEHLQKVNEICIRRGLQPLIWSDSKLNIFIVLIRKSAFYTGYIICVNS